MPGTKTKDVDSVAELIESLPNDPYEAGCAVCDTWLDLARECKLGAVEFTLLGSYRAMLPGIAEVAGVAWNPPDYVGDDDAYENDFGLYVERELRPAFGRGLAERCGDLFREKFTAGSICTFAKKDASRIQELINELRDQIVACEDLSEDHRRRLLRRLEKLQGELAKKVSDLDRFWGLLKDGAMLMETLGKKAKPMIDRIREIVEIVYKVEAKKAKLPASLPFKLLGSSSDSE